MGYARVDEPTRGTPFRAYLAPQGKNSKIYDFCFLEIPPPFHGGVFRCCIISDFLLFLYLYRNVVIDQNPRFWNFCHLCQIAPKPPPRCRDST